LLLLKTYVLNRCNFNIKKRIMLKISAVIITFNEEKNIDRCIKSLKSVADEIVVVDSVSKDKTKEICLSHGVMFIEQPFLGYREQKNFAITKATYPHILSLDADEAVSEELKESILEVKKDWKYDGYYMNRFNNYCGQWIRHSNWYPDKKLRLFDSRKGEWKGINPHDRYEMKKGFTTTHIKGDLLHWVLPTYESHIEKANKFSTIAALEYYKLGKKATMGTIIFHSFWRFVKAYFLKKGFLDGYNGFVISAFSSYTSFLKYIKLRQLNLKNKKKHQKIQNRYNPKIAS